MRSYTGFTWQDANYRICSDLPEAVRQEIVHQRTLLEEYILHHKEFLSSLVPLDLLPGAPEIACQMACAARLAEVGPMAAVAGAIAEAACCAAVNRGAAEAIVENGGDIFLYSAQEIVIGIYTGRNKLENKLAFRITAAEMPLAVCSSSSRMGHSLSFGNCDLACVTARDGALADAAATFACNSVKKPDDMDEVLKLTMRIPGVQGVLLVEGDKIGMAGKLPELIRNQDASLREKITRHPLSLF